MNIKAEDMRVGNIYTLRRQKSPHEVYATLVVVEQNGTLITTTYQGMHIANICNEPITITERHMTLNHFLSDTIMETRYQYTELDGDLFTL